MPVTSDQNLPTVVVLYGGRSSEHGISCVSAGSVIAAIDRSSYRVIPVGITRSGCWIMGHEDPDALRLGPAGELPEVVGDLEVMLTGNAELISVNTDESWGRVDVVFPVMHGPWGQDGTVQGLLEMSGVRYVGAGVLASAVGTDKHFMKQLFAANGLPVADFVTFRIGEWRGNTAAFRDAVKALGYPVFVKPARAGSSFGITKVDRAEDLDAAVEEAATFDPKVLVEAGVIGAREVEVGVLARGDEIDTSAIAEITVGGGHAFYDFEAKYLETSYRIPADLGEETTALVEELALRAFRAIDGEGLSRVDFFVLPDGSALVNEIETMPGFTSTSMFPLLWQYVGVGYPVLIDCLINQALGRETDLR